MAVLARQNWVETVVIVKMLSDWNELPGKVP